jgi:ribosomal protein S27AE
LSGLLALPLQKVHHSLHAGPAFQASQVQTERKGEEMTAEEQIQKWKKEDGPILTREELLKSVSLEHAREQASRYRDSNDTMSRDWSMMYRYGFPSVEEYRKLRNSPCLICGELGPSEVDHNHVCSSCGTYTLRLVKARAKCGKCGIWLKIRGPLCRRHNTQMGFLESIRREGLLPEMLSYLERESLNRSGESALIVRNDTTGLTKRQMREPSRPEGNLKASLLSMSGEVESCGSCLRSRQDGSH